MDNNKKASFDKRRERHFEANGNKYAKGFEFYIKQGKEGTLPVMVNLPNIISLYLSISDKSLKRARLIFNDKLESNIRYVKAESNIKYLKDKEHIKKEYYKYNIENNPYLVFDLIEETFISVVFAYSAVEATINNLIPNSYAIIKIDKNRKVIDDKEYIEKYYKLTDKIKDVIGQIYKIDIDFNKLDFWNAFKKLEYYRNEIVHFKSEEMLGFESNQIGFLTDYIFSVLKNDVVESARKLILFLTKNIDFLPGLPYEFSKEPINIKMLQNYYGKKNFMERIDEVIKLAISDFNKKSNNRNGD